MFSTSHLRMAIVFVYKGDLYGELTVDFWKVVTSEASKHCCFIMYHLLILLGRTTESARIKVFEASYSKWKGKFSLPLSSLWEGLLEESLSVVGLPTGCRARCHPQSLMFSFFAVPALAKLLVSQFSNSIDYVVWHHFWISTLGLLRLVIFQECWASLCFFCLWTNKMVKLDLHENGAQVKFCPNWFVMGTFCSLCFRPENNADFSLQAIRRIN